MKIRNEVFEAMQKRSLLNEVEVIKYIEGVAKND